MAKSCGGGRSTLRQGGSRLGSRVASLPFLDAPAHVVDWSRRQGRHNPECRIRPYEQIASTMLSSPAKRRKISETASVSVGSYATGIDDRSKPTTPTRKSYLSPTKSSLARSHPHLAQKSQRRSQTEPRNRVLQDELLRAKSGAYINDTFIQPNPSDKVDSEPSGTIKPTQPDTESVETEKASRPQPRPPLQNRQPSIRHSAIDQQLGQPPIVPKLVRRFEGSTPARAPSPPDQTQPLLPPTPVELGWEEPPERPKGLSSSSPRGSKSGSGRHRKRLRDGLSVTSSPLKPKHQRPAVANILDQESEAEMMGVPSSRPEVQASEAPVEVVPAEIEAKRTTLKGLKAELQVLQASSMRVERATGSNAISDELLKDTNFSRYITSHLGQKTSKSASYEQLITTEPEASKYLNLFSPGCLHLEHKSSTKLVRDQPKVVHHLTVTAPPPWPPHVFSASFDVVADPETMTIENIVWTDTLPGKPQSRGITDELFQWLDLCMKSEIHGCNIGNLIWSMGQYFERAVQRAKAFMKLEQSYNSAGAESREQDMQWDIDATKDEKPLTEDQAFVLTSYLSKTQLIINLPSTEAEVGVRTRRVKKAEPKVMITWCINLSWNGTAKNTIDIIPSGVPDTAVQSVKELFQRLLQAQGFEKSFDAVYELMKGQREATPAPSVAGSRQGSEVPGTKAKAKKRKRFS